jgi:hypothetical protein
MPAPAGTTLTASRNATRRICTMDITPVIYGFTYCRSGGSRSPLSYVQRRLRHSTSDARAARGTRPLLTKTPSVRRRRACSLCSRENFGNTIRPPAPTTRCHGTFSSSGATFSANPAWRARPGNPAARATAPYVATWPRGIAQTTCQIACSAGFSPGADFRRDPELVARSGRNNASNVFFARTYPPRPQTTPRYE